MRMRGNSPRLLKKQHASTSSGYNFLEACQCSTTAFADGDGELTDPTDSDLPGMPPLAPGHVHVWYIRLGESWATVEALERVLSRDEQQRAARFVRREIGHRFIVARARMRQLLAAYLERDAAGLEFAYSGLGKPRLCGGELEFNLSHSNELALLAVCRGGTIGVDVEHVRPHTNFKALAKRFFAPEEVDSIEQLSEPVQLPAFFCCWTRKEAILKAVGKGLTYPLNEVVVSVLPDDRPHIIRSTDPQAAALRLFPLSPGTQYVAALAAPHDTLEVHQFRMREAGFQSEPEA